MPFRARSLRLKLVAWFVLVFFSIQAILVGGIVFFRRGMIQTSLESDLALSAEAMVENILVAGVTWDSEQIQRLVPSSADFLLYAIRDEDGTVLASRGVPDAADLPFTAWEVVPTGPVGGVHTLVGPLRAEELTGDPQKIRLITLPFRHHDELYYFQAGVRDRALEQLFGPFVDLVLVGVPVGVVAAMVAAWVIAGRAVSPIRELSRAAKSVSPKSLGDRIQVSSTDEEVERLESELNSALERLEAGYRAQDQFISNVSHELRTPVAVLLTQAQVAKMGERSLEKGYGFVDKAEELLKRLGSVVESFLMLARADMTKSAPSTPVQVHDLVLDCLKSCRGFADRNQVYLVPSFPDTEDIADLTVAGDAELLHTMLHNLVRNAIRHSPREEEIRIDVERSGTSIRLYVRDRGPGIPEEYLERVFERFVRVPEGSAGPDGTGLGLAIASGVAQLHQGTIEVWNNEEGGCTFAVTLPLRDPA